MCSSNTVLKHYDLSFGKFGEFCGVDEVGVGSWFGPVVSAAAMFIQEPDDDLIIRDSKMISCIRRSIIYDRLINLSGFYYGLGFSSSNEIDSYGISKATTLSMYRAIESLKCNYNVPNLNKCLIDGCDRNLFYNGLDLLYIIDGDAKSISIGAASIIAKVSRDRYICNIGVEYNVMYHVFKNKGYGTNQHIQGLSRYGVSNMHRVSYNPIKKVVTRGTGENGAPLCKTPKFILVTGYTCAGKTMLVESLLRDVEGLFIKCITCTTRPPRHNEIDGVDYRFLSYEVFQKMIENGEVLEFVSKYGYMYGVAKIDLEKIQDMGKDVILVIDPVGMPFWLKSLRDMKIPVLSVFIKSSNEDIVQRLLSRNVEPQEIETRLQSIEQDKFIENQVDIIMLNAEIHKAKELFKQICLTCIETEKNEL